MKQHIKNTFDGVEDNEKTTMNGQNSTTVNDYKYLIYGIKGFFMFCIFIGLYLGKLYTPTKRVECLQDPIHDFLTIPNTFVNNHLYVARFLQITSSLGMDFAFCSAFIYWLIFTKSYRFFFAVASFYTYRNINQFLLKMTFPQGFYWDYPGFYSLTVPYGFTSDFFFSGHAGFLMICFLEWRKINCKRMSYLLFGILTYMILVLLIFRTHYSVDITTGVLVAHYLFQNIDKHDQTLSQMFLNKPIEKVKQLTKQYYERKQFNEIESPQGNDSGLDNNIHRC